MNNFKTRLENEQNELLDKLNNLQKFIPTEKFDSLPKNHRHWLVEQGLAMGVYLRILNDRLADLEKNE